MQTEILKIFETLRQDEIIEGNLDLTFNDGEGCMFRRSEMRINIDYDEVPEVAKELHAVTCENDEELLETFKIDEIIFFHELGHYCDFLYRLNGNERKLRKELLEAQPTIQKLQDLINQYADTEISDMVFSEANKIYRQTVREKYADENAYNLMKYYLDSKKELTEK